MHSVTRALFEAFAGEFGVYSPLPGCFEHYGLDFLVDDDLNVVLLEVNPGPDFKQTGKKLQGVVKNMWEETLDLTIGNYPYDKEANGNVFTKVWSARLRGGNDTKVSMKMT